MSMFRTIINAVVVAVVAFTSTGAQAQNWSWSSGFENNGGPSDFYWDSIVFNDGSGDALYACCQSGRVYKFDGHRWSQIGQAYGSTLGVASGPTYKLAVADPDGPGPLGRQLFVVGQFRRISGPTGGIVTATSVARWNGTTWTQAGSTQFASALYEVRTATTFDDGTGEKLYIGGKFPSGVGNNLAVRSFTGTWTLVGSGLPPYLGLANEVYALHAFDDGSGSALYVGGLFEGVGGVSSPGVIKWTGTAWQGLGVGVQYDTGEGGRVYGLTSFDDGTGPKLYASGNIASSGGDTSVRGVAKWNSSTATWSGTGADYELGYLGPYVRTLDLGSGPALYVCGRLGTMATQGVARRSGGGWAGLSWSDASLGHPLTVSAFDVDGAGPQPVRLLAMGSAFDPSPATAQPYQFDGSTWQKLPYNPATNALPGINQLVMLDADGAGPGTPALYATGMFSTTTNGQVVNNLGKFDGSAWTPAFGGLPTLARYDAAANVSYPTDSTCVQVFDDGSGPTLYVGGGFNYNDNVKACRAIKWNGSAFVEVGGGIGLPDDFTHSVSNMTVFREPSAGHSALFACGTFALAGTATVSNIARWDGMVWSDVGGGVGGGVGDAINASVVFDDGTGPALYVAGSFPNAGGTPAANIAKWNGSAWSDVGGGLDGTAYVLAVHNDGGGSALYVGGSFTTAGGVTVNRLAKWSGTTWSDVGGGMSAGTVRSLASLQEGSGRVLFAGGTFATAGGVTVNHIGRWDGTAWSSMQGGMSVLTAGSSNVKSLAVLDTGSGPTLFASGYFDNAGPLSSGGIARWIAPGVCCRGSTCNASVAQAACTGSGSAGASFTTVGSVCNAPGVSTTPCCYADFNKTNGVNVQDIFDFLSAWFAGNPYAKVAGDGAAAPLIVQDIFDFLSAWFVGC
jgi:hypothetical protein